jgi:Rrf2 family protein
MDVLRRNTDYGLRMMAVMATGFSDGQPISAKELADGGHFSYQLGSKLLQKLHKAGLVKSEMGPKGGFTLSREPEKITLMQVIKALQGEIRLNRCLLDGQGCEFQSECEISAKISCLQLYINGYLDDISLAEIVNEKANR